jgi:uncharacterized alkaline shock family protein YloU
VDGRASISTDILAGYAADAAREVDGVRALVESRLHRHRGVRVNGETGAHRFEVHVETEWGASIPEVAREVQQRVRDYLARMADVEAEAVDVVVDDVGPAA